MLSYYFSCTKSDAWLGGGGQTHRFRQYLKKFVEILNGNNVRKCEKKSASFTVYVALCETNCTNEESALSVSPSSKTFMPLHFVAFEKSNREKFVLRSCVLKGTLSADRKELRRRQRKGLISALFEARWSCKSWGLITSHEVMQRNRTQRYDLSVLKWHPHTPFCLFTLGCNMKSLFSIRHTVRTCLSNRVRLAGPTGLWRNLFPIMSCMKHLLFPWSPRELPGDSQAGCELLPDLSEPPSLCLGASY